MNRGFPSFGRFGRRAGVWSVKPGRGPSAMGAAGSLFAVVFGIGWTVLAFKITAGSPFPGVHTIFPLFGVGFVLFGLFSLVYNLRNAVGAQRNSIVEVAPPGVEPDPLNGRFGRVEDCNATARRLQELDELRRRGVITTAEHTEQRRRIIAEI